MLEPAGDTGSKNTRQEPEKAGVTQGPSIFVAEDHPATRQLLEKLLTKAGYRVTTAGNGREALDIFKHTFHPLILVDWSMPELSGLELCAALREAPNEGYVYIIFLTARDSKNDVIKALEAGADDYVTKPFNQNELMARIKTGMRILALERSLKEANEAIRLMSNLDPLTRVYNRRYLNEHLEQEVKRSLRYGHPLHLALCDIDHFKAINDTYGHQSGDEVLIAFAELVKSSIRQKVDWVARYGGEEFILVLPETDAPGAYKVAERLREAVAQEAFKVSGHSIHMTVSWGVSGFHPGSPHESITPDLLLGKADRCLYQAKQEGRNRVKLSTLEPLQSNCRRV
jgi:two-component system, cell cycle response regulator